MKSLLVSLFGLICAGPTLAQSINIDFGTTGNIPPASYGAAGAAGVWNEYGNLPTSQEFPLVGLDGASVSAVIYMIGPDDVIDTDDPAIVGEDGNLMDDMLIGYNDPIDVCVFFKNFQNGWYEVITYGLTPNDPNRQHQIRVDNAGEGPIFTGGAWPGHHREGVTFARHYVNVTVGRIGLHSGEIDLFDVSGINGIQIRLIEPSEVGELDLESSGSFVSRVYPNPGTGTQRIELRIGESRPQGLEIVDVAGRLVWRSSLEGLGTGLQTVIWDGTDRKGHSVSPAVYFARLSNDVGVSGLVKLIRTR